MLKLPEAVAMMDPAPGYSKQRTERRAGSLAGCEEGYHISYPLATLLILLFCSGLLLTGFIVYLVRPCGDSTPISFLRPGNSPQSLELEGVSASVNWSENSTSSTSVTTPSNTTGDGQEDNQEVDDWPPFRLPNSIVPDHYKIDLIPFLANNWTFHGLVQIRLNVTSATTNVTLHAKDIEIDHSQIKLQSVENSTRHRRFTDPSIKQIHYYDTKDLLVIHLNDLIASGRQLDLFIPFKGEILDDLKGLYRSSYTYNNETRWLVVTLLQATYARSTFPCFDEPGFKSVFHLRLGRPVNMSSLSNMPKMGKPEPINDIPGYVWDTYEPTLPMSSYLLSFAVTDFVNKTKDRITVWARAEAINQSDYALEISEKSLEFYERYFGIPYPLPKIDILALPDFEVGAMENWGLVTSRESLTLVDRKISTPDSVLAVARVMAHELAHQWYGNLVTPRWWSDIWLNEGFATYMEEVTLSKIEPNNFFREISDVETIQNCMNLDYGTSNHPLTKNVNSPLQIDAMFDHISYQKGASLIRMMDYFLSPDVFQDGVKNYLKKKAYSSAAQNDLWQSLTEAARKKGRMLEGRKPSSVQEVMDTWTLQSGFPVLTVTRDYKSGGANLSQMPFEIGPYRNNVSNSIWYIPVTYTTQAQPDLSATRPSLWLTTKNKSIEDLGAKPTHWVIFNLQQTGYYRVNYDKRNWHMLISHLQNPRKFKQFDSVTRSQLIDDSFSLAQAGLLHYEIPLELSRYLRLERELLPWLSSLRNFAFLSRMSRTTGKFNRFRRFMLGLLEPTYNHLGFYARPNEKHSDIELRSRILEVACSWEHDACLQESISLFHAWRMHPTPDTHNPIPGNLKAIVYCTAIQMGGEAEWDFAWQRYLNSNLASEREELLGALGCSRLPWILRRYMEWGMDPESEIRRQDVITVFSSVGQGDVGRTLLYQFVADKWEEMDKYFDDQQATTSTLIVSSFSTMNSRYQVEMVSDFLSKRNDTRGIKNHFLDTVMINVDWMERYFHIIDSWLKTTLQSDEK